MNTVFVDTSAFKALFDFGDEFHEKAAGLLDKCQKEGKGFITSNFILDETYTLFRAFLGKPAAIELRRDLAELKIINVKRVLLKDEGQAWKFFVKLPGRGVSFTDCTSFALMKRLGIKDVFAFDADFKKAGFNILT